ncbi:MAG TPA: hypothetical protein VF737_11825 [Gemmatimonadaceae bacterium]
MPTSSLGHAVPARRTPGIRGALVRLLAAASAAVAVACGGNSTGKLPSQPPTSFAINPCSVSGTLQLAVATAARVDCSNGGTTVTVAGNGASYLVVPEFATDQAVNTPVAYSLAAGDAATPSLAPAASRLAPTGGAAGTLPAPRPNRRQMAFDASMLARGARLAKAGTFRATASRAGVSYSIAPATVPDTGTIRSFHVLSSVANNNYQWKSVNAKLVYKGTDILLYVDTLAPSGGFTSTQLQQFGQYFDQTLFPIDTANFGPPSDIDANSHVIMLMSPVVNGLSPAAQCSTQGYIAGFFNSEDFAPVSSDPNSNYGEIFYSIVPDPNGTASCTHSVSQVQFDIPSTFLHELQHLVNFSQHVVLHNGAPEQGWLDEGLSIVAEEEGAVHYEQRCPPPTCRTDPTQIFPDSAEPFVQGFLYDSYQYALLPDTASVTLHSDADGGFSWRGGDWLLVRWMGDQTNNAVFRKLEDTYATGVSNIENAMGEPFPNMFSDFGLALYTDSLPGMPRNTAPAVDRFVTRNVSQLWARLYTTSGPAPDIPYARPLQLFPITADTSASIMSPGTTAFYRLDTPSTAATVVIQFAAPGVHPLATALQPQLAIFRLPPGQ